jgi:hypothetical protein
MPRNSFDVRIAPEEYDFAAQLARSHHMSYASAGQAGPVN